MEKIELKFTRQRRSTVAPTCPCGQKNSPNAFFNPFDGFDGQYGHCHKCDKDFFPEAEQNGHEVVKYVPMAKLPQKFITPEPVFNMKLADAIIEPEPTDKTAKLSGPYHITWYYRNINGKLASAKKMLFNFPEFKRDKDSHPVFPFLRDSGYYPCLFNERDLSLYPNATVLLVESEKTAALLRFQFKEFLPEFIYLAVGGANGLSNEKLHVLRNRNVLIIYDCDNGIKQDDGTVKGPKGREASAQAVLKLSPICNVQAVDLFPDRNDGTDLADIRKEINIEFIRSLKGENKVPDGLVEDLKSINRLGEYLDDTKVQALGEKYMQNTDKITTINTTIRLLDKKEFGVDVGPLIQKIECWLLERYDFKFNTIIGQTFSRRKGEDWKECNENDIWRDIHHNIRDFDKVKRIAKTDIENLMNSDFVEPYNPIHDYFNSLPSWDGYDHITLLANHIIMDDQNFWIAQFKKALVRMIACSYGSIENRIVMTLVQESQESGKSSYLRFLCPPELKKQGYYKEESLAHNKDTDIALAENFLWNLEELADLNRKEIAELKAIISKATIKQRRSYGKREKSMQRIVNFWGSTNKVEFLSDTQNTRWLCFNVLEINQDYNNWNTGKKNVDINKVWAQAWHLYNNGFDYNLTREERQKRDIINKNFESMTDEKQLLMRLFEQCPKNAPGAEFMVNVQIAEVLYLSTPQRQRIDPRNIGRAMTQLGFTSESRKINGKTYRGYWLLKVDANKKVDPIIIQPEMFPDDNVELPF